ncbi:ABC transporter permease [filamentous cyanobacterium LEGE 11480]|uniref:ABC transporter permease n=1 Tax=Romeriopsis navalis LEGE 11480 TaxID=2777977 RepID=A0A928VL51_9CYAN|nr:ABC transporter permease [Romeriopsis navalis]MBE9028631.1 ABC transporter permease [Romeriopsis navalis LEGE 11480]
MNIVALSGAIELGLLYGLVALGVYLSFRVLDFPDLTADGSFPLGGAVAATLIVKGVSPVLATMIAVCAGALSGICTASLNVKFKILNLLASILTMIALYSINLRIMGQPNVSLLGESTILTPLQGWLQALPSWLGTPLVMLVIVGLAKLLLDWFFKTEIGLAMRATGANPDMARAQGINTDRMILLGMGLSNGLIALAGALFAQVNGFADVTMGVGTIVFGLAAVIVGETILSKRGIFWATLAALLGSVLYRLVVAIALNTQVFGLQSQDLNLVTAVLVALALILPNYRKLRWRSSR